MFFKDIPISRLNNPNVAQKKWNISDIKCPDCSSEHYLNCSSLFKIP